MKRADFIKIIKLRSVWKIDKRKGNYKLPNGERLDSYVLDLVESQMKIDKLGIKDDGDLCFCNGGNYDINAKEFKRYILMPPFKDTEYCTYDEMERRIQNLVSEIIG